MPITCPRRKIWAIRTRRWSANTIGYRCSASSSSRPLWLWAYRQFRGYWLASSSPWSIAASARASAPASATSAHSSGLSSSWIFSRWDEGRGGKREAIGTLKTYVSGVPVYSQCPTRSALDRSIPRLDDPVYCNPDIRPLRSRYPSPLPPRFTTPTIIQQIQHLRASRDLRTFQLLPILEIISVRFRRSVCTGRSGSTRRWPCAACASWSVACRRQRGSSWTRWTPITPRRGSIRPR